MYIFVFIIGAIVLHIGVRDLLLAMKTTRWPKVSGKVITSGHQKKWDQDDRKPSYNVNIEYQFEVDGVEYQSNHLSYKALYNAGDLQSANNMVGRYPVSSKVTVFYNPADPQTSVLVPGFNWTTFLMILGGAFFIFLSYLIHTYPNQNG